MRRHLGCPYANKNVFSNRQNSPRSVSGRRNSSGKLFQIRGPAAGKLRSPKRVRVLGTMHVSASVNAGGGETYQRKPRCNHQQGKMAPSRATTYKLARPAYSPLDAEPAANGG